MTKLERRLADICRGAAVAAGKLSLSLARHKVGVATLRACAGDLQVAAQRCNALADELEKNKGKTNGQL